MDIVAILSRNYAGAKWSLDGDKYEGLDWFDDSQKPSKADLEAAWPAVQSAIQIEQVQRARAIAYRETADSLFFKVQRGEATEAEWLAAVEAVRQAHPYPAV